MMLLADVTKIKCKFVQEIVNFLNKRKYAVDPCIKCKYTYYADLLKVLYGGEEGEGTYANSCLDHDIECDLTTKASKYSEQVTCLSGEQCASQVSITLAQATKSCIGLAETENSLCNCKYPTMELTNNSTLVNANIDIVTTFSGSCSNPPTIDTNNIQGGCDSSGCNSDNLSYYSFGFNSDSTNIVTATSFITKMRVYLSDSGGNLTTMKDLILTPGANDYQVDDPVLCNGCASILDSELQFGDPNFTTAFNTLMDNISLALFGVSGLHRMNAWC